MITGATFEDIWKQLDVEKIASATNIPGLADFDYEAAKICVYDAAERWLLWDIKQFLFTSFEEYLEEKEDPKILRIGGLKAYLDLAGTIIGEHKNLKEFAGKRVILDWKTSRNALDKKWKDRQILSHQWRIYSHLYNAGLFIYRGIQRAKKLEEETQFREIILAIEPPIISGAVHTVATVGAQIEHLISLNTAPWPRTMPAHCNDYNRECVFLSDCDTEVVVPGNIELRQLSYSRIKDFMKCPEYYRRTVLALTEENEEDDSTEFSTFGKAVHGGLAEIYQQVYNGI